MKKTIVEIYALAVCFFTIICFSFTIVFMAYNIIRALAPSFTISAWQYAEYQSNEQFCSGGIVTFDSGSNKSTSKCGDKSPEEITKLRLKAYTNVLDIEQKTAMQNIIYALILLLTIMFIYVSHWRIARKARQ